MKRFIIAAAALLFAISTVCSAEEPVLKPNSTHRFAQRDTCDLYLDIYNPAEGSQTHFEGIRKPTIIYIFGGGFRNGDKRDKYLDPFYKRIVNEGYTLVAINYRLGLKDPGKVGMNDKFIKKMDNAIGVAVEDLFSATNWLIENGRKYGIDPDRLVVAGGSAGAITALQAEWEICNGAQRAQLLPGDFNYAGVVSYAGAIFSKEGDVKFAKEPCPILMFHGVEDKIVKYDQIWMFKIRLEGSNQIARTLQREGYNYRIYRYLDRGHEIAISSLNNFDILQNFIENNVMLGTSYLVDATVYDPTLPTPDWSRIDVSKLYDEE